MDFRFRRSSRITSKVVLTFSPWIFGEVCAVARCVEVSSQHTAGGVRETIQRIRES